MHYARIISWLFSFSLFLFLLSLKIPAMVNIIFYVSFFRLSDVEKDAQELQKQHKIDSVTITNLENDLVSEKLKTQQLRDSFDALGLTIDNVTDPDKVLER